MKSQLVKLSEIEIKISNNSQAKNVENEITNYINQFSFEKAANKYRTNAR